MPRDFTGKALATFFLYWCGYVPGLLANLYFLFLAAGEKDYYGEDPPGQGCLVELLIVCGIGPIIVLGLFYYGLTHLR